VFNRIRHAARRALFEVLNRVEASVVQRRAKRIGPRVSARDHRHRPLEEELRIAAYWIERPGEVGPAVSVFWRDQEVMRLDLFDEGAHIHYGLAQALVRPGAGSARIYLPPISIEERAERARFELRHNLEWCLRTHPSLPARRVDLDRLDLDGAADWLRAQVLDLDTQNR
jgi:hypothetical protein